MQNFDPLVTGSLTLKTEVRGGCISVWFIVIFRYTKGKRSSTKQKWIFQPHRQANSFLMVKCHKQSLRQTSHTEGLVSTCTCCCFYILLITSRFYYRRKIFKILPLLFRFNFKKVHFSPLLGSETFCFLLLLLCLFFWIMLKNYSFPC